MENTSIVNHFVVITDMVLSLKNEWLNINIDSRSLVALNPYYMLVSSKRFIVQFKNSIVQIEH